jgi:hypothetical protein
VPDRKQQQNRDAPGVDAPHRDTSPGTLSGGSASTEALLSLQRSAGNQAVASVIARFPFFAWGGASAVSDSGKRTPIRTSADEERKPIRTGPAPPKPALSTALGFESRFQNPGPWADRLKHPMTQTLIRLLHKQLWTKFVDKNEARFLKYAGQHLRLTKQLWRALYGLQDQAPSRWMFQGEFMVLGALLSEIENATRVMQLGAWSEGREDMVVRSLQLFDVGFARVLSGTVKTTRAGKRVPGGTLQRRIYVGTAVVPGVICNFFLVLNATFPAKGGAPTIDVSVSDEVGASHDVKTSKSVGVAGSSGGASVDLGPLGPESAGGKVSVEGAGGTEATGSVKLGKSGKPEGSVEVKGEHGKVEVGTSGIDTEFVAPGKDWKATAKMGTDGSVSYSATHPRLGGVTISGSFDKASLRVLAPELKIAGVTCQAELIVELWPIRLAYSRTQTQTPESLEAFRKVCLAMMAVTGVPVALGAGAGAVVVVAEGGAPVLIKAAAGAAL